MKKIVKTRLVFDRMRQNYLTFVKPLMMAQPLAVNSFFYLYSICRLDEDLTNSNISVTVAAAVEEVTIEAPEELVAGMDGNIICTVKGGRPAPILDFDFGESSPDMVNDTITQTPGMSFESNLSIYLF